MKKEIPPWGERLTWILVSMAYFLALPSQFDVMPCNKERCQSEITIHCVWLKLVDYHPQSLVLRKCICIIVQKDLLSVSLLT